MIALRRNERPTDSAPAAIDNNAPAPAVESRATSHTIATKKLRKLDPLSSDESQLPPSFDIIPRESVEAPPIPERIKVEGLPTVRLLVTVRDPFGHLVPNAPLTVAPAVLPSKS